MSKNMEESEEPQMTSQHGAYAFRAVKARLHAPTRMHKPTLPGIRARTRTHTQICNTYYFSTATLASRTRLNITVNVYCLFCL